MTTLGDKLDTLVFAARGAVTPQVVEQARALVIAEGGGAEAVEAFRDRFDSFRSHGYFDAPTRAAVEAAYTALVQALPEAPEVAPGSAEALTARLGQLQSLVASRKIEVGSLETQLAKTEAEITAKASQASTLLSQKQQYQQTLQQKERDRQTLLIFALFGAFGGASAAVGLGSALSIAQLRDTINKLDAEIASTQKEKASLEAQLGRYKADQRTRRREVDALQAAAVGLEQALDDGQDLDALAPEQKLVTLRGRIGDTQKLAENLRQQIELLVEMNASATSANTSLTTLIAALKTDLKSLEDRIASSEKALLGTVIDLVFKSQGQSTSVPLGPFSIPKKVLLLDGLPGLRLSLEKQLAGLMDKLIADDLVSAGAAPEVAKALVAALRKKPEAERHPSATLAALSSQAFGALSEPQRLVLDALVQGAPAGEAREALIGKIAGHSALSDVQARAVAAIALVAEGPAAGRDQAIDAVLADGALSEAAGARAVIGFALDTTYGPSSAGEAHDDRLDRLARLARRALSFLDAGSPAARALTDGLTELDEHPRGALEDHALLRAYLTAARALLAAPSASGDRVALEVMRGWRMATAERSGDGVAERQRHDAERALAAMARLLPAGDPTLAAAAPADLAGLSARLAQVEEALAARVA